MYRHLYTCLYIYIVLYCIYLYNNTFVYKQKQSTDPKKTYSTYLNITHIKVCPVEVTPAKKKHKQKHCGGVPIKKNSNDTSRKPKVPEFYHRIELCLIICLRQLRLKIVQSRDGPFSPQWTKALHQCPLVDLCLHPLRLEIVQCRDGPYEPQWTRGLHHRSVLDFCLIQQRLTCGQCQGTRPELKQTTVSTLWQTQAHRSLFLLPVTSAWFEHVLALQHRTVVFCQLCLPRWDFAGVAASFQAQPNHCPCWDHLVIIRRPEFQNHQLNLQWQRSQNFIILDLTWTIFHKESLPESRNANLSCQGSLHFLGCLAFHVIQDSKLLARS